MFARKPEISSHVSRRSATHSNLADQSMVAENKESECSLLQGSSIDAVRRNNPLCDVVDKFATLRRQYPCGAQKPKLAAFIKTFENTMVKQE